MGKHDAIPEGAINEALERHYQETIKTLNEKLNNANDTIREMAAEIEKQKFTIEMKDSEVETLRTALVETLVEKTEAKLMAR